jgi:outer membrane protein assembly factor BamB
MAIACRLNSQPIQRVSLKYNEGFQPVARGAGFKTTPLLESDGQRLLFTADNQSHSIYEISNTGDLLISNEKHGQGPGDLNSPMKIDFSGDDLFVVDFNGLSIFGQKLVFKNRIRMFKDVYSIAASDKLIYMVEGQSPCLITAYDHSGKEINSFGDRYNIDFSKNEDLRTNRILDVIYHLGNLVYGQHKIYFISQMLGDIFAYSEDGQLIKKGEFHGEERIAHNKKILLSSGIPDLKTIGLNSRFFGDAQWSNGSIYALVFQMNKNSSEIWEIDGESLKVKTIFEFKTNNSTFNTGSLAVIAEDKLLVFFVSFRNRESGDVEIAKYEIPSSLAKGQR